MEPSLTIEQLAAIKEALLKRQKVEAIKLYRDAAGVGLAEAKSAVEKVEAELRVTSPESFKTPERRGCLGVVVLCVFLLAALIFGLSR